MRDGLERLDPKNPTSVADAARLHAELLPTSPVVRLGPVFMRRFYYRKLVDDGLVGCSLYYADGIAAGFIAYTASSSGFMSEGLRRHWLYLSAVLGLSVLQDPRRIGGIVWTVNHMRKQRGPQRPSPPGELLSFGVLREFRTPQYVRSTGRRISMSLYDSAIAYFRERGVPAFRAVVETSNREALLFYHALECEFRRDGEEDRVEVICTVE